jgi:hypothetical protein
MIHYVVVHGTPRAVEDATPRLAPALASTRIMKGKRLQQVAEDGTWAAAGITKQDPIADRRLIARGNDVALVNGPALSATGHQDELVRSLLRAYRARGAEGVVDELGGAYNFVGITPERGLCAFGDFSGLFPLYWGSTGDLTVVGTRSTTVRDVLGTSGWQMAPLAWVVGHANLFDAAVPAAGVRYVPPGHELRSRPGGRAEIARGATWAWPSPTDAPARDNLTDDEWDAVTASLIANLRSVASLQDSVQMGLTGGKDSRLVLSLALAAGLGDKLDAFTTGPWDSPEIEASSRVAKVAGIEVRRVGMPKPADDEEEDDDAPPPAPPPYDSDAAWKRLREVAYRYEGMVCAWSGLQNVTAPTPLRLKGFGGEFFRRGNALQFRGVSTEPSIDELAELFVNYHQKHDPLNALVPEVAEAQRDWCRRWVHENAREVRPDLLPEKFYIDHRLGHWSGPFLQNAPVSVVVNPLLSAMSVRANLELTTAARGAERFHYEVMRRAAPELVSVPFLDATWAPLIRETATTDLPDAPMAIEIVPKRKRSWGNPGWPLLENDALRIEKLFHAAMKKTDMGEICNMRRLKRIAQRAPNLDKSAQVKELFSCIGVAQTLLGDVQPIAAADGA